jgi:formylmethanofuran dehydrogenase subunit E
VGSKGLAHYLTIEEDEMHEELPPPQPMMMMGRLECEGCGERFARAELNEVVESLTYFPGDLLCFPCVNEADAEVI